MLLDDNELDNFINQKTIEANHFASIVYVNSGSTSALEFLNNLTISGEKTQSIFPEIIFVDINMPMMNGFQFIENFKKRFSKKFPLPKLVILTSSDNPHDRIFANEQHEDVLFFSKPLTPKTLNQI